MIAVEDIEIQTVIQNDLPLLLSKDSRKKPMSKLFFK